jgi:hypothetical protein
MLDTTGPPMVKVAVAATDVAENGIRVAEMGDLCLTPSLVSLHVSANSGRGMKITYLPPPALPSHAITTLQKLNLLSLPRTAIPPFGLIISTEAFVIRL